MTNLTTRPLTLLELINVNKELIRTLTTLQRILVPPENHCQFLITMEDISSKKKKTQIQIQKSSPLDLSFGYGRTKRPKIVREN